MNAAHIPGEVEALFQLLDERAVAYLLGGGVAMLAHVRGRDTEDVDLVISLSDQNRLAPKIQILERESFFARARFRQLQVGFLEAGHALFALVAKGYAVEQQFDFIATRRPIRSATPAGLMILKLYALPSLYRQGQIERAKIYEADIGQLLAAFPEIDLEELFGLLLHHGMLESDVAELRKVVAEQQPRPDRFGQPK